MFEIRWNYRVAGIFFPCAGLIKNDGQTTHQPVRTFRLGSEKKLFLRLLLRCPLQEKVYQKIVHRGEASEMENCGNSPKNIRVVLVNWGVV